MGRIRILSDNVANKIAAGEVVERQWPMSVNIVVTPKEWAGEQDADGSAANSGVQADG